jgi:hypothetical protein
VGQKKLSSKHTFQAQKKHSSSALFKREKKTQLKRTFQARKKNTAQAHFSGAKKRQLNTSVSHTVQGCSKTILQPGGWVFVE